MKYEASILVAADTVGDASVIGEMLGDLYSDVVTCAIPEKLVSEFDRCRPEVLVLAFKDILESEQYYRKIRESGRLDRAWAYRALVLCSKEHVDLAYSRCREGLFDDYVVFWPLNFDPRRIFIAIERALENVREVSRGDAVTSQILERAALLGGLSSAVESVVSEGATHASALRTSLEDARGELEDAIEELTTALIGGELSEVVEVRDPLALQEKMRRVTTESIDPSFERIAQAITPACDLGDRLLEETKPQLQAAESLYALSANVRKTILVVDDDGFQMRLIQMLLGKENYNLLFASSGLRALSICKDRQPDLVLIDIHMPDVDGVETTRRIKSLNGMDHAKIIMMTGQSQPKVVIDSVRAGANDFLVKPIRRETLLAKIQKTLQPTEPILASQR